MSNNIYNILGKLKGITDTAALTPDTQPTTVYESVEARGSITEAVKDLEAKYKTFKESKADDIADKKAEKEAGDWWGDKKADSKKSREVKGDKYGGSKQKSDDEDDFKSKKTAILDKDEEEVLDEAKSTKVDEESFSDMHKRTTKKTPAKYKSERNHPFEKMDDESKAQYNKRNKAQSDNALEEGLAFGDTVKNSAAKLSKAPKAKLVKESASVRNHPIYTNPDAWDHYKKELDEEELNKATQELGEISKLAGLPKQINVDMSKDTKPAPAKLDPSFPPAPPELPPLVIEADSAVSIRGRGVNVNSIEVDGVDTSDYPDFSDAYITYAEFTDGTPLSEFELDQLADEHGDLVNQAAHDNLQGAGDFLDETEMEEGNEFSGALAAAKASGIKDFEVAGKKYTVKEDINVNVTASGEEDALNLIRKLSGMPVIAVAQSEEMPDSSAMEVEIDEEFANAPHEHIAPTDAAIPSGSDLHGTKRAYKIAQPGDNPMAVAESKKDTSWNKYTGMLKGLLK